MDAQYLLLSVEERVATVTINRPDKGNSLSPDVLAEIEAMFSASSENMASISASTSGERELPLSGRLIVTVATLSSTERRRYCASIASSLPVSVHLRERGHLIRLI